MHSQHDLLASKLRSARITCTRLDASPRFQPIMASGMLLAGHDMAEPRDVPIEKASILSTTSQIYSNLFTSTPFWRSCSLLHDLLPCGLRPLLTAAHHVQCGTCDVALETASSDSLGAKCPAFLRQELRDLLANARIRAGPER